MSKAKSKSSANKSTARTKKPRAKKTTPKGLGDTIEQVTKATGIKKAVDWFSEKTGIDCGCEERKEKLNQLVPYEVSCMDQKDYNNWKAFREADANSLREQEQKLIVHLHAKLFNHDTYKPCTCAPKKWQKMIDELNTLYDSYEQEENQG